MTWNCSGDNGEELFCEGAEKQWPTRTLHIANDIHRKTLPMAYVTFSTVMCIIGFQVPFIVIQFGWLVSYVWLRFYKKNTGEVLSGGPAYGDRSETFAFVSWFPPFIQ